MPNRRRVTIKARRALSPQLWQEMGKEVKRALRFLHLPKGSKVLLVIPPTDDLDDTKVIFEVKEE